VTDLRLRSATAADVPAINAIYNEYIVDSHVSFDTEPWTDAQRLAWYQRRISDGYPVLVAVRNGSVVGAGWSGPWRDKAAYRRSVETTVVLAPGSSGAGIGSLLLGAVLEEVADAGFSLAIAIVALPNDGSVALHRKLGFTDVGVLEGVGFKDGAYHDTLILQKRLASGGD
jgi:phosphinothricin acetyltransferase